MNQEQNSNVDFVQTQEAIETLEVDFDNVNLGLASQTYDLDAILNDINTMEDLSIADDVFCKLQSELQGTSEYLKYTQQQNADKNCELNSSKYCTSELEKLQCDEQNGFNCLRDMTEQRRTELEQMYTQQINNLVEFESDGQKSSDNFMNGPKLYLHDSIIVLLEQMKKEVENSCKEHSQYKQDLQVSEGRLRNDSLEIQLSKGAILETGITPFDDSIKDITTLNEKLTTSVEQLKNRYNTISFQMRSLKRYTKQ